MTYDAWHELKMGRTLLLLGGMTAVIVFVTSCAGGSGFCDKHSCISNFDSGRGYIVQCADGEWSHSGGVQGACSGHGGEQSDGSSSAPPSDSPASSSSPPAASADFCSRHTCIPSFDNGSGYIVQCQDGEWSHSGGEPGACSDHGGETGNTAGGSGAAQPAVSVPKVPVPQVSLPTPPPIRPPPSSNPVLTGPQSASSNGYSLTLTSFKPEHSLDVPGGDGTPPEFGIAFTARCKESGDQLITWDIQVGSDPTQATSETCLQGSFGESPPPEIIVGGCGPHTLTVSPDGLTSTGNSQAVTPPMRFPFHLC